MEREPTVGFKPDLPLDHEHVAPTIAEALDRNWVVMIADACRHGKKHLKLHKTRDGKLYVRVGYRGSGKKFIDRCDVTYLDGKPILQAFKFVKTDYELRHDAYLARIDAGMEG
jgi:hypothetical protein